MIYANVDDSTTDFISKNSSINQIIDFIKSNNLVDFTIGAHGITPTIRANIQEYLTKAEADGRWESHKKFIDFQFIISGEEFIKVTNKKNLTVKTNALAEKDALYYEKYTGKTTNVLLQTGDYLLLTPDDAHEACLNVHKQVSVKKAVIKLPVSEFIS